MDDDQPQDAIDDVVKGCFGVLLKFGAISVSFVVIVFLIYR